MKNWNGCIAGLLVMFLLAGCAGDDVSTGDTAAAEAGNEEITNNQEDGVDEGGIVKNIGDHLVVLREGRLFALDVSESGAAEQTDWVDVPRDASLEGQWGVWYDEMLVEGNDIYVVGYRYDARVFDSRFTLPRRGGATEINHFVLDDEGALERKESLFFESHDYFSGSNYTSRLIGDKLIFYMPVHGDTFSSVTGAPNLLKYAGGGTFITANVLLKQADVRDLPDAHSVGNTIHAIFTCSVADGMVEDCEGTGARSSWYGTRYVTRDAVYLANDSQIVRMSLTDGSVVAQRTEGSVRDQFSMHSDDENLYVVVTRSESTDLLTIPHDEFGSAELDLTRLDDTNRWHGDVRFTDGFMVLAAADPRFGDDELPQLIVHELQSRETTRIEINAPVAQVKRLHGIGALVVTHDYSAADTRPQFLTIMLDGGPRIAHSTTFEGLGYEWRSHAFFYKPNKDPMTGGTFGIPIEDDEFRGWGSASGLGFYTVGAEGELAEAGRVFPEGDTGPECTTSCVDWYGNSRPVFLFDRVYALMGYELAEVAPNDDGRMAEVARVEMALR